jgi:Putative zinc-finger
MTVEGCREWRERLGAYVLGHLPEDERAATAAHLEGCGDCRDEAELLAPLAELLPKADPAQLGAAPAPPAELGDRITAQIAGEGRQRRSRRRKRLTLGFSAAAATAATAAVLLLTVGSSPAPTQPGETVTFRSLPRGVQIAATVEPRPFGTQIRMNVHGIRSGTLCRVSLRRADGSAMPAGSFRYRYDSGPAVLSSALDLSAARAISVRAGGRTFTAPMKRGVGEQTSSIRTTTEKEES